MAVIELALITTATPEPYDEKHEHKQRENLAYAVNQMIAQGKANGFQIPDKDGLKDIFENVNISISISGLDGIEQAIQDLKFNSVTFTLGNAQFVFDGKTLTHITS